MDAYPFVDAHLAFCGSAKREKPRSLTTLEGLVALTHALPCSTARRVSEFSNPVKLTFSAEECGSTFERIQIQSKQIRIRKFFNF